jgi:aminopeptidase N
VLLAALLSTTLAAAAPGASSAGDPLFPGLGNGGYDVQHYTLSLRYPKTAPVQDVRGHVTIDALAVQDLSRFNLDFRGGSVASVRVGGASARYRRQGKELIVTPAQPIAAGARFTVGVRYRSGPKRGGDRAWIATPEGSVAAAQPNGAHRIFPSNDHPSDLATYTIGANTPAGSTFVANGERVSRTTRRGRTTWVYRMEQPMASELIQLAFGRLRVIDRGIHAGVHVRDVVTPGAQKRLEPTLARVRDHLDYMIANAGPYPFGSYGSLVSDAPFEFALETQSLSLFGKFVGRPRAYEPVMVHELAHQWYGDSVAPARWSDLWLNEGHATWFQWTYSQEKSGFDLERHVRAVYAAGNRLRRLYGPIAKPRYGADDVGRLYSPMVYDVAGVALYALRLEMGDAAFRTLLRAWPQRYAGQTKTTADYIALASEIAGRDLGPFLNDWLYGTVQPPMPGHPTWR